MDITRRFGRRIVGSSPAGGTRSAVANLPAGRQELWRDKAGVVELVDTYASEAYDRKVVGVQVSPPAQLKDKAGPRTKFGFTFYIEARRAQTLSKALLFMIFYYKMV